MIILFIAGLIVVAYAAFINWCWAGWKKIPLISNMPLHYHPEVSVIIPARNEEKFILACLQSLSHQQYPADKLEVILIDDHSTDNTLQIAQGFKNQNPDFKLKILRLSDYKMMSKKDSIRIGINASVSKIILTSDADCIFPETWLNSMVGYFSQKEIAFVAGPVLINSGKSILSRIQSLEFMGLIGIAAAGIANRKPMMCNGANLAYLRTAFHEAGGFGDQNQSASGDDTKLMIRIASENPEHLAFAKHSGSIVSTQPVFSFSELVQQRRRWASKIPFELTPFTRSMAVIAWLAHAVMLLNCVLIIMMQIPALIFGVFLLIKIIPEFLLLNSLSKFFRKRFSLWLFLLAQPVYWIFIVLIGILTPFGFIHWKGRKINS